MHQNLVIYAPLLLLLLTGCGRSKQAYRLNDVTKPQTITLVKKSHQDHIHYLTVEGAGKIDGTAELSLILNGKKKRTETFSGDVQFLMAGEWYSDSAQLEFTPSSVKGGNLTLRYHFKDH